MGTPVRNEVEADENRLASERAFHNERFGAEEDLRAGLDKWYIALAGAQREQDELVRECARGASVLEYGCADGALSLGQLRLHEVAERLVGIDISDQAIEKASRHAERLGARNAQFLAMNAEAMDFPDATFDVVFGRGIIHHLDLARAYPELRRVTKPGGRVIFLEPLGHNLLINRFRDRTPHLRTPDEHPLVRADYEMARRHFRDVEVRCFGLTTLAAVPLGRVGRGMLGAFEAADRVLLALPGLRWQAWIALSVMTR